MEQAAAADAAAAILAQSSAEVQKKPEEDVTHTHAYVHTAGATYSDDNSDMDWTSDSSEDPLGMGSAAIFQPPREGKTGGLEGKT